MTINEPEHGQDDINVLLRHLDHPSPPVSVDAVIARARAGKPGWGKWAAGILLVAGLGGVAYAIPGSPVPGWIEAVMDRIVGTSHPPVPVDSAGATPESGAGAAGIAVEPGRDFQILFSQAAEGVVARITVTGGTDVVVRAPAGAATFTSDINRLIIGNLTTAAVFEIAIPHSAARVEIRVGDRRIFLKEGDSISADSMTVSNNQFIIPLRP